jgi:hypothetical protein
VGWLKMPAPFFILVACGTLIYEVQQDATTCYIKQHFDYYSDEARSELLQKLNQLLESEMITAKIYARLKADILANHIKTDIKLFSEAYLQIQFLESLKIKKIERYLKRLIAQDILTPDGKKRIIQDIKSENANTYVGFFKYVKRAVVFDRRDYSSEPSIYLLEQDDIFNF